MLNDIMIILYVLENIAAFMDYGKQYKESCILIARIMGGGHMLILLFLYM